jgi:uncharacterized protein YjbJ (UPF0337 family)
MESYMNRFQEKAQALTKQAVGQMIGDDKLVIEGKEQERHANEQRKPSEERASTDDKAESSH